MTKRRAPLSSGETLRTVADLIGWKQAARICRRAERTLYDWSDEDVTTGITLDAAHALDSAFLAAGGGYPPFLSLQKVRRRRDRALALPCRRGPIARAAIAASEAGEAVSAQILAYAPDASRADRIRARHETEQAIAALGHTLLDLDAA